MPFGSSIFKFENNPPLFSNQNKPLNDLFNSPNKTGNNKTQENPNLLHNNNALFQFNNINKVKEGTKINQPFSLQGNENKNDNESLFNQNKKEKQKDEKSKIFGEILSQKREEQTKLFGQNNNEDKTFFAIGQHKKEKKIGNLLGQAIEEKEENLFVPPQKQKQEKENLFEPPKKEKKIKALFGSEKEDKKSSINNLIERGKTEIHINSLHININTYINNDENQEEGKKEETNNNKNEEKREAIIFGTPKKEPKETKTRTKQNDNIFEINTSSNINNLNNINNISSSKRLEDNEEIQNALKNLYVSDILCKKEESKNGIKEIKPKRTRPIDFILIFKIEGITNINEEGYNLVCKPNENMSNLMKQVKFLVRKKYKMNNEQDDFEFNLIKNNEKLPINEKSLIGDYIKNKDKIIVFIKQKNSDINEDTSEEKEENDEDEKEEKYTDKSNPKNLCPKDKLPILKRPGYFMNPNEYTISRMTIDEINNVQNFEIYNENGKIHFDNAVSIYGVNFDKLFIINHDLIEYEKGEWCHSPRGTNFNIPATITFYNINPNINLSNEYTRNKYIEFLKEKCRKNLNGKFISYNTYSHELTYKIPYFY